MRSTHALLAASVLLAAVAAHAAADDVYYEIPLPDLKLAEGELPQPAEGAWPRVWRHIEFLHPRAVLDGEGEAYVRSSDETGWRPSSPADSVLTIRAPEGQAVSGLLIVPDDDLEGMVPLKFTIDPAEADADAEGAFQRAKLAHHRDLQRRALPGSAWFRFRARQAADAVGEQAPDDQPQPWQRPDMPELQDTFALFTGGRAVAENLQLDRALPEVAAGERTIDLASLEGITVREYDWTAKLADAAPALDPLASLLPADQHAVFFPSFKAFMAVLDEAASGGGLPLYSIATPRPEDARTLDRYERQLGLARGALARLIGPRLVRSVALTGSDPYFPTGTDVALLFESPDAPALRAALLAQVGASAQAVEGAEPVQGEAAGLAYTGFRSPGRVICSYIAEIDGAVLVTNSLAQLERLAAVRDGNTPDLASLDEYKFFRQRYPRAEAAESEESAFLVLTDAAIRRWCGPRWRIATARRTVAAAVLADAVARRIAASGDGEIFLVPDAPAADLGGLFVSPGGVTSNVYGSLTFLTPIAELPIDRVTQAEADAYRRWRDTYQQNWRQYFDPIAVSFSITGSRLAGDLTVMPLIGGSDYNRWVQTTRGVAIDPAGADPHDTLAHFAFAVNRESPTIQQYNAMGRGLTGLQVDPLGWLAGTVAVYADPDPLWQELADAGQEQIEQVLEEAHFAVPIALHAQVGSALKLTAFLNGVRTVVDQTTPGMLAWETRTHNEQPYVRIGMLEAAKQGQPWDEFALYYAATPTAFVLSPSESVIQRSLDRQRKPNADAAPAPDKDHWLGQSMGLNLAPRAWGLLAPVWGADFRHAMQARSWENLPILNEWKRLHPKRDPAAFHLERFGTRPRCPGGGEYVWNERYRTMESTVYGHPGEPREGPGLTAALAALAATRFGVTFEDDGLRARAELNREQPAD